MLDLAKISARKNILYFAKAILLFAFYFQTARWGLDLDAYSKFATLIWPPTGIAIAGLYIFGLRFWPAVFIAAWSVNASNGASFSSALGIGTGNTIEALVAVLFLRKLGFDPTLRKVSDVIKLVVVGGLSPIVAATIGVASLQMGSPHPVDGFWVTWWAWWIGDGLGAIIVAPAILIWAQKILSPMKFSKILEFSALILVLGGLCFVLFGTGFSIGDSNSTLPYVFFPLVIWAALRFEQRGAVTSALVVSFLAVWGSAHARGPFALGPLREILIPLTGFMSTITVTGMCLASSIMERRQAIEDRKIVEEKLKDAIKSRDEFFSIASHELKTPITSLALQIHLTERQLGLKDDGQPPNKDKLAKVFEISKKQVTRLTDLIEDLLDVSRIRAGKLSFSFERLNLSELIRDMSERFTGQFKKAQCQLSLKVPPDITINGDQARLEQVLDNLFSNIIKYAPESTIDVSLEVVHEKVRLVLVDDGPGIPKDKQNKIFDRYERAFSSKNISGLGLGLFIVREIVTGHHGTITLESDEGLGTKFTVELPVG